MHGGDRRAAARIDDRLRAELQAIAPLAPLHQPKGLSAAAAT